MKTSTTALFGIALACSAVVLNAATAQVAEDSPFESAKQRLGGDTDDKSHGKIILGAEAAPGAYPFQISMIVSSVKEGQEQQGHFCGGTLIADTWVLTAAHCVTYNDQILNPSIIDVYVGSNNFKNGDRIPVKELFRHPDYATATTNNDIALLKLARPPRSDVKYSVISLVDAKTEGAYGRPGTPMTIIGWGATERGEPSAVLRESKVQMVDRAACNSGIVQERSKRIEKALAPIVKAFRIEDDKLDDIRDLIVKSAGEIVTDSMICAGETNASPMTERVTDTCQGDSGGPLFTKAIDGSLVQVGIVSWGEGCGLPRLHGVYTRLSKYVPWVMATTNPSTVTTAR